MKTIPPRKLPYIDYRVTSELPGSMRIIRPHSGARAMDTRLTPASHFRNGIYWLVGDSPFFSDLEAIPEGPDRDARLLEKLDQFYQERKDELAAALAQGAEDQLRGIRLAILIASVGLLTFGRLHVVFDAIDNSVGLAPGSGVARLRYALSWMFPVPEDLHPEWDPTGARKWFEENVPKLKWNQEKGAYEFSSAANRGT